MTTSVVYGIAGDGYIVGDNTVYASARSTATMAYSADSLNLSVGQDYYDYSGEYNYAYQCLEGFVGFDTSVVSTDAVSSAVASYYLLNDYSITDFTVQMRVKTWSAGGLTTADWIAGASLTGQTLVAHKATSGIGAAGYKDFVDDALAANINGAGNSEFILHSDRHSGNNAPTGNEYGVWQDADYTGTTQDPYLTIVHTAGSSPQYLTPAPLAIPITVVTPSLAASGAASLNPAPVVIALTPVAPSLAPSSAVSLALTPVTLSIVPVTPGLAPSSAASLNPAPIAVDLLPVTPTVTASGTAALAPAPVVLTVLPVTPSLSMGEQFLTPAPLVIAITPVSPTFVLGAVALRPAPVVVNLLPVTPTWTVAGTVYLAPAPLPIPIVVPTPSLHLIALDLKPAPVVIVIVLGSVSLVVGPACVTDWTMRYPLDPTASGHDVAPDVIAASGYDATEADPAASGYDAAPDVVVASGFRV